MSVVFDVEMQVLDSEIPVEFAQEIRLDPPSFVPKTFTANGTYSASADGADGYNPVTVDVQPPLEEKTVTENGEVTPTWAYGLSKVTVKVDTQSAYDEGYAAGESAGVENGIEQGKQEILNITNAGLADFSPIVFEPATEETLIDTILECAGAQWNDGFERGKKAEYDRFWDTLQHGGGRTDYQFAFCNQSSALPGWTADTFEPKYSMRPTNLQHTFRYWVDGQVDFGALFADRGLEFDTSDCVSFLQTWQDANGIVRMPVIDTSKATNISYAFAMRKLVTFDKFIPPKTKLQNNIKTAFNGCYALENIVVEGDILQDINFSYSSKLTHDSLMSIIGALTNNTEGTTLTCTLGKENLAKITDSEKAIATEKGWTLA